jgi:hypothetical protein
MHWLDRAPDEMILLPPINLCARLSLVGLVRYVCIICFVAL